MATCGAVFFTRAMAGIAAYCFGEMRMAFHIGCGFGVALPAELVNGGGLSQDEQQQQVHALFRTSRFVRVLSRVCPAKPIDNFNSAASIQSTRSTPG